MYRHVGGFGVLALALLFTGVTACGDPGKSRGSASVVPAGTTPAAISSSARTTGDYLRGDNDEVEGHRKEYDDYLVHGYGHEAGSADRQAIAGLVKRYYATAAALDSAAACLLMHSGFAKGLKLADEAESYAPALSAPPLRGERCDKITSLLFKEHHQQLVVAAATLVVTSVRVNGPNGLALLGFKTTPERQMPVEREGGTWKIDSLFDREIP